MAYPMLIVVEKIVWFLEYVLVVQGIFLRVLGSDIV